MAHKWKKAFEEERSRLNEIVTSGGHMGIKRFFALDEQAYHAGALPVKVKELLGLVASLVLRCDDCVSYHLIKCREHGLIIPATMCECNRLEKARDGKGKELDYGVEDAVRAITGGKTTHHSLTTAKDILPSAYEILDPGKEIAKAIETEYKEHGIVDIKLI